MMRRPDAGQRLTGGAVEDILRGINVAPSILSADFSRLGEEVETVLNAGARVIHFDVMDGQFVPNITVGPLVARALGPLVHGAGALLDVHLMIEHPERYVTDFVEAGADVLVVHQEACIHLHRVLAQIREAGALAGVALNPATPIETLSEARYSCDLVVIMSVNPGFGGQSFIPTSTDKIARARAFLPDDVGIEVDGGVSEFNAGTLVAAGATWLVAGSSVFGDSDIEARFKAVAQAASSGV
jgi:ribulose-phosphate 3-epimerase